MKTHLPLLLRRFLLLSLLTASYAGAAVGSIWDPAWGSAGLAGAPDASEPRYQASLTQPGVLALVQPSGSPSPYDFGTYTAITLTGSGNAGAFVVGGASASLLPLVGAVSRDSWLAVEQGTYSLLVGGNYADNWQSGEAFNFTGNSHIALDGATVANIVGGNYKEGRNATFTGNSYISVLSGSVTGAIVGATVVTHNANTSFTGDTHIFVYTPLNVNSGPGLNSVPTNMIVGGFAWGTNTWKTQVLTGNTHVTVDLSSFIGAEEFSKHIVGGGFNGSSTNTQTISGGTNVSVNLGICVTAPNVKVVGGPWVNAGTASVAGTANLTVSGGTFNSWVIGGAWTDTGGTSTSIAQIAMQLSGGLFNGNVLGATYISTGNCTMNTGDVAISLGSGTEVNGTVYGGYYINGTANAVVDASLGDVTLHVAGGAVNGLVGGSYTVRNNPDNTIEQGNITLNLLSGSVGGDVWAAGWQDGSTKMQTASVTVNLSSILQTNNGMTLSGGYGGSGATSLVTGERTLVLTDAADYENMAGVAVADFDVVAVPTGGRATFDSLVNASSALRKTGAGELTLASHGAWTQLTVEGGLLALQEGVSGETLESVSLGEGATLSGVSGTIVAGSSGETALSLVLGSDNIGADAAASPMIRGLNGAAANLTLTGAQAEIALSGEGVIELLLAHRDASPAVSSYLTLVDGTLTCEQPAQLSLGALLSGYGLRVAGVAQGSLVVNGSAAGIYYVTANAATTDPHLVTAYPLTGLYSGVLIEGGQTLTLRLPGDDSPATQATIRNLMGGADSALVVENSTGSGVVSVVLSNLPINSTGDAQYPDLPAVTTMQGSISAGAGTVLHKRGSGELVLGGNLHADTLSPEAGTLTLNGSDNRLAVLNGGGGSVQLGGSLVVSDTVRGGGVLTVGAGGRLLLANVNSADSALNLVNHGRAVADVTRSRTLTLAALTLGSGSVSELRFNADSPFERSLSLGALEVQSGATVVLTAEGTTLLRGGDYVLGRVTDPAAPAGQAPVNLTLQGFAFEQLQPGASYLYTDASGNILLHAVRSSNRLLPHASSPNAMAGARLLWDAAPPAGGELSAAYLAVTELISRGDAAGVNRALAAVAGSSFSALAPALQSDVEQRLRIIRNRTATMGVDPCVVNEDMPYFGCWVHAEGDQSSLSGSSGFEPGYDLDRWGATLGLHMDFSPEFTAGLALSTLWGKLSVSSPDYLRSDVTTTYLSLFARYRSCAWVHSVVGTFGWADFDVNRTVMSSSSLYRTTSSTHGRAFGLMYELAYAPLPREQDAVSLQPLINISYRHSSVDSLTERVSDAALHASPHSMGTLTLAAGARMQAKLGERLYNRSSLFECRALLAFDLGDRRGKADVALLNGTASGTVRGAQAGAFGVELGAGLSIPLGADSGTLFFDASLSLRSHLHELNGVIGYQLPF